MRKIIINSCLHSDFYYILLFDTCYPTPSIIFNNRCNYTELLNICIFRASELFYMISKKCKYAIKALIYIAKQADSTPVMSSQIAENEGLPKKFLETILRDLTMRGYLQSSRGKYGGYKLRIHPKQIILIDIMRDMDGPLALSPCVSLNFYENCDECHEQQCTIRPVLEEIRDATLSILKNSNLFDLANLKTH